MWGQAFGPAFLEPAPDAGQKAGGSPEGLALHSACLRRFLPSAAGEFIHCEGEIGQALQGLVEGDSHVIGACRFAAMYGFAQGYAVIELYSQQRSRRSGTGHFDGHAPGTDVFDLRRATDFLNAQQGDHDGLFRGEAGFAPSFHGGSIGWMRQKLYTWAIMAQGPASGGRRESNRAHNLKYRLPPIGCTV